MIICPVCGYRFLREDALNHGICPSCGTEFGYDDVGRSHESLRMEWLCNGGEWFDKSVGPPAGWDALTQVMAAFYPIRFGTKTARKPITSEFQLDTPLNPVTAWKLRVAG
jgi:hypothetical protein